MRFFDVGQQAEGVIAIGQQATGFLAIGQVATGVIAIGQGARGVIAIGQLAVGLFAFGMLSVGLIWSGGMLGVGGRRGIGGILPLVPVPAPRRVQPATITVEAALHGAAGWIDATLREGTSGLAELARAGVTLPIRLAGALAVATSEARAQTDVFAFVEPSPSGPRASRLMERARGAGISWPIALVQFALLAVVSGAYWQFVLIDVGDEVLSIARAAWFEGFQ